MLHTNNASNIHTKSNRHVGCIHTILFLQR